VGRTTKKKTLPTKKKWEPKVLRKRTKNKGLQNIAESQKNQHVPKASENPATVSVRSHKRRERGGKVGNSCRITHVSPQIPLNECQGKGLETDKDNSWGEDVFKLNTKVMTTEMESG